MKEGRLARNLRTPGTIFLDNDHKIIQHWNNRKKKNWGSGKEKRASGACETVTEDLTLMSLSPRRREERGQGWKGTKIMAKSSPNLARDLNLWHQEAE